MRNLFQNILVPNPVFEHLTWHFDKISFYVGSREFMEICLGTHLVHCVAKFMEKGNYFSMKEQRWFVSFRRVEISHDSCNWLLNFSVNKSSCNEPKARSMIEFIWSGIQIKIKMSQNLLTLRIFNLIHRNRLFPSRSIRQ